jgi:hypothetical protein
MKLLTFILSAGLLFSLASVTYSEEAAKSEGGVDEKTTKAVLEMEKQLALAIEKRDVTLLDKLLADYYADAYSGSEKALTKRHAMARCQAGTLLYYAFDQKPELSRSAEMVTIEGVSKVSPPSANDAHKEPLLHVKRLWANKDGRWLLVVQRRGPAEGEQREREEKQKRE